MTDKADTPLDFEASLNELESLVEKMESEELKLEDALACFEKGIGLTKSCHNALQAAEQKVKQITQEKMLTEATE